METHAEILARIARYAQATEMGGTFRLWPHGSFEHGSRHDAPTVVHDETEDVVHDAGWEALTGMTGQHGYNGAVMHPSEYIGTGIAARLCEIVTDAGTGQTFAVVTVDDPEDGEPIGWAILRYVGDE